MSLFALIIGYIVVVTVLWYGIGFAVNSLVLYPVVLRTPPWRRSRRSTPHWLYKTYYFVCGPIGWIFWLYDKR